jgi:glyoxylase-like metal-dependent hydrolase (beta-lactamase superfamily II)
MRLLPHLSLAASGQIGLTGRWDCHAYAVLAPGGVVLVDAGSGYGAPELERHVAQAFPDAPIRGILLTHAHADHFGGAARLRRLYGCTVAAPACSREIVESGDEEGSGLAAARALGGYPADFRLEPCPVDSTFGHAGKIEIAGQVFEAIQVRGHSADSFCFRTTIDNRNALFSADVVFYGGVLGLINSRDSSMAAYAEDLPRLAGLNVDALLPGHGLFTVRGGQRHIDAALEQCRRGFLPRMIGQWDVVF